ncbi:reverse transcriptase/ribonuclease h/methyltransferase [Plakobranchus ocellatus]|uniref:Reverse transcriptase/ribonuclease h/methyltransferase n=1 Tax=Plakobranchus ocellatus TaxID=259542 RepID=A0AAV4DLW0_9GAST|nr:reverse transcriptase/ribonuclease h/methyltransferase [Plakobranchus ocellatus]
MEWRLNPNLLQPALRLLNAHPSVDLFASRLNHQFSRFVSYRPDPDAFAVDAFHLSWSKLNFYAFPPFCLLSRVLQKIKMEKATGTLVAPLWPTQPFFPILLKMLTQEPVVLSARKKLLYLPSMPEESHPLHRKLRLVVCKISGSDSEKIDFRWRQQNYLWTHGAL